MSDTHEDQNLPPGPESVAVETTSTPRPAPTPRPMLVVCPYCGHESLNHTRCERCKGLMDPLSRQASQNAMGPWFIRDESLPFRPGCNYDTLRALIAKGRVTRDSVLRGPSTRQFWTRATSVPGIAHLLGECHSCHTKVSADFARCPGCSASFDCSMDRQGLGLAPVRLLPGHAAPEEIARSMMETLKHATPSARAEPIRMPSVNQQSAGPEAVQFVEAAPSPSIARILLVTLLVFLGLVIVGAIVTYVIAPDVVSGWLSSSRDVPT